MSRNIQIVFTDILLRCVNRFVYMSLCRWLRMCVCVCVCLPLRVYAQALDDWMVVEYSPKADATSSASIFSRGSGSQRMLHSPKEMKTSFKLFGSVLVGIWCWSYRFGVVQTFNLSDMMDSLSIYTHIKCVQHFAPLCRCNLCTCGNIKIITIGHRMTFSA